VNRSTRFGPADSDYLYRLRFLGHRIEAYAA
jgi:hypothetical protein